MPCDTIRIIPSKHSLDEGITLKDHQRLIGLGKSVVKARGNEALARVANPNGPTVVLANHNEVSNLYIKNPDFQSSAILVDNVDGAVLRQIQIRQEKLDPAPPLARLNELCLVALDQVNGEFDLPNSTLRGCDSLPTRGRINTLIDIMAEDQLGHSEFVHTLDGIKFDIDLDTPVTRTAIVYSAAGDTSTHMTIRNMEASGTFKGINVILYQNSKLELDMDHVAIDATDNDGLDFELDFSCADNGIDRVSPGTSFLCDFLLQVALDGIPPPRSAAEVIANVQNYRFTNSEAAKAPFFSSGLIVGVKTDQSDSRIEIHMRDSEILGAADAGIAVDYIAGEPAVSIIDLGCVDADQGSGETCADFGMWDSPGNNRIIGNGGIDPRFIGGQLGFDEILLINYSGRIGPVFAQGNYWGDLDMDGQGDPLGPCAFTNATEPFVLTSGMGLERCYLGKEVTDPFDGFLDASFELLYDPAN